MLAFFAWVSGGGAWLGMLRRYSGRGAGRRWDGARGGGRSGARPAEALRRGAEAYTLPSGLPLLLIIMSATPLLLMANGHGDGLRLG